MKPIPEALRAYFPAAVDDARPWWHVRGVNPDSVKWARNDGPVTYSDLRPEDRGKIDRADPLPPPPILVGQVWASPLSGGRWRVSVIAGVVHESDGTLTITFANDRFEPGSWLHSHSILLTCPFGYAPWSGSEVT